MSTISNLFQQSNPYEKFVQQLVQIESQTKLKLQVNKGVENEKKSAIGAVSSSISQFVNKIKELQNPVNNNFHPLSATSSDSTVVRITNSGNLKNPSTHNITIDRLATQDTVLSGLITGEDSDLAGFGDGSVEITIGDQTELIEIETTYEDEGGATVQKTNSEILNDLSAAITDGFSETARSSTFQVNGDNVQLSIQSLETGEDHQIQFANATGVLDEITGASTHLLDVDKLDALFTIDGVEFERGQNEVDDALDGLTIELRKATGEQETASLTRDVNKTRTNINGFISAFNNLNKTIRDRTFIDTDNDRRGALQDIRSIRNLTINLRQTGLLSLESAGEEDLQRFTEIGISFRNNGEMYVEDSSLLNDMIRDRPDEVEQLFVAEDSVVSSMKQEAELYSKSSGLLKSIEDGIDQKISRIDRRIASQDRYLEQYEERQRDIFNELQLIIAQGDQQFQQVMSFRNRMGI
ncbi:MAG: flagellar filament capping protein FliD [Balneolaceae bacterium]